MEYFNYCTGLTMTNDRFHKLFGAQPRSPESPLTQREMDLAASIQEVIEAVILRLARSIRNDTGEENLCLAGGVALNCVANGKVLKDGQFKNLWIQPSAGDAGGALGAAYVGYHHFCGGKRHLEIGDAMKGSFLGPAFSQTEIESSLGLLGAKFQVLPDEKLFSVSAQLLADGKALGWFQGRMEYGPRALGARSILGDARSPTMQSVLNMKVKYRESFRPFAPSVLRENVGEWFDLDCDSPYMLLVSDVLEKRRKPIKDEQKNLFGMDKLYMIRSEIPAVTHVDYSARVQTVHESTNPRYYSLISKFKTLTGCPVLVNTSFNVRGEPIVCSPEDAFRCFMGTDIDALSIGNCLLYKNDQNEDLKKDYKTSFSLD